MTKEAGDSAVVFSSWKRLKERKDAPEVDAGACGEEATDVQEADARDF